MASTFNLVHEPWVPTTSGLKSLAQVFQEAPLDVSGDAQVRISVYRLLVAIGTAAIQEAGLAWDDGEDLAGIGPEGVKSAALAYLAKHAPEFELFDADRPWLQSPASVFPWDEKAVYPVGRLREHYSEGSNAMFRDEQQAGDMAPADIALGVLVTQTYSVGYKKGKGSTAYGKVIETLNVQATPNFAFGGGKFVTGIQHVMLRGRSLLETAFLNLIHKDALLKIYRVGGLGVPYWEHDPTSGPYPHLGSAFGRLIPAHVKHIRVSGDKLLYAGGQEEAVWPSEETYHSSEKFHFKDKKEGVDEIRLRLRGVPDAGLWWRDMGSFLADAKDMPLFDPDKLKGTEEVSVLSLGSRSGESMGLYKTDSLEGSASVLKSRSIHDQSFRVAYRLGLRAAQKAAAAVRKSSFIYAKDLSLVPGPVQDSTRSRFWELLSADKSQLILLAESLALGQEKYDEAKEVWYKRIRSAAYGSFDGLEGSGFREKKAYAKQLSFLRRISL